MHYTAEDFIQDPWFREWVLSHSPRAEAFWRSFQHRYPERQASMAAARALLLALHESQPFPTEERGRQLWDRISQGMELQPNAETSQAPVLIFPAWKWLSVAAIVLAVLGVGWLALTDKKRSPATYAEQVAKSATPLVEKTNSTGKPLDLRLSDGSRVVLYPGSRLSYGNPFTGTKRELFLSGKGYFEVVKDDTKPFIVFSNQLVTKVVGTSFIIDSYENNASHSVQVRSGKVKIFRLDNYREAEKGQPEVMVLLTANQQANFNTASGGITTRYVAKPELLKAPAKHPDFHFENAAVSDVFKTLEDSYGVTIEYNQQALEECRITAPLGDLPLFRKLDIVCQTIGATYEVWGTRIMVKGAECSL